MKRRYNVAIHGFDSEIFDKFFPMLGIACQNEDNFQPIAFFFKYMKDYFWIGKKVEMADDGKSFSIWETPVQWDGWNPKEPVLILEVFEVEAHALATA